MLPLSHTPSSLVDVWAEGPRLTHSIVVPARTVTAAAMPIVDSRPGAESLTREDGLHVAVFADKWRLATVEKDLPAGALTPIFG